MEMLEQHLPRCMGFWVVHLSRLTRMLLLRVTPREDCFVGGSVESDRQHVPGLQAAVHFSILETITSKIRNGAVVNFNGHLPLTPPTNCQDMVASISYFSTEPPAYGADFLMRRFLFLGA